MTVLELFKFAHDYEKRWEGGMLLMWLPGWALMDFTKMITSMLDDGGIDCRLQSFGTVCVDLVPVCEHYGFEAEHIFPNPDALIKPTF